MSTSISMERYVPQGQASLITDAPGWAGSSSTNNSNNNEEGGPTCWKCRGAGHVKAKKKAKAKMKTNKREKRKRTAAAAAAAAAGAGGDADDNADDVDGYSKQQIPSAQTPTPTPTPPPPPRRVCPVCTGRGSLPPKLKSSIEGCKAFSGMITRARSCPTEWVDRGPCARVIRRMNAVIVGGVVAGEKDEQKEEMIWRNSHVSEGEAVALRLLHRASCRRLADDDGIIARTQEDDCDVPIDENNAGVIVPPPPHPPPHPSSDDYYPPWVPSIPGEQLCNLVGNWRILQRVGSHRWTTDDVVTAYVASRVGLGLSLPGKDDDEARMGIANNKNNKSESERKSSIRYLDLGTGNASVLQMTCWALWESYDCMDAYGIEARSEAVGLARRSLSFNVGQVDEDGGDDSLSLSSSSSSKANMSVHVVHSDFRDLVVSGEKEANAPLPEDKENGLLLNSVRSAKFDLVTGTPPYFRVDFATDSSSSSAAPAAAATQSSSTSSDDGAVVTVVKSATIVQGGMPTSVQSAPARCEFRGGVEAYCSAAASALSSQGRFVVCENWLNNARVYDGAKAAGLEVVTALPVKGKEGRKENLFAVYVLRKGYDKEETLTSNTKVLPPLAVRDQKGERTRQYAKLMKDMSIPSLIV